MDKNLISIGEMAKLYEISTQTLRYYERIGLLSPIYINKESGYRYYSLRQCLTLDVILYLKHVGTPLAEITALINKDTSTQKLKAIMENNKKTTEEKIKELYIVKDLIDTKLEQLHEIEKIKNFGEVYVKHIHTRTALVVSAEKPGYYQDHPDYLKDIHYAARQLTAMIEKSDYPSIECEWGFYGKCDKGHVDSKTMPMYEGFFAISNNKKLEAQYEKNVQLFPEGDYVCTIYKGNMFSNETVHQLIFEYAELNGIELDGFFYDSTLFTGYLTANRDDYIMELKFKIK